MKGCGVRIEPDKLWGAVKLEDTTHGRRRLVMRKNIEGICQRALDDGENPVLLTLTMADRSLSYDPFKRSLRRLVARLRRHVPGLCGYGRMARQLGSGVPHAHIVLSRKVSWEWVHAAAVECGLGRVLDLRWIGGFKKGGGVVAGNLDIGKVARYIASYSEGGHNGWSLPEDKGLRLIISFGVGSRTMTNRFEWSGGVGQCLKIGIRSWQKVFPGYSYFLHGWNDFERLVKRGYETLTATSKHFLVHGNAIYDPCMKLRAMVFAWQGLEDPLYPF